MQRRKRVQLPAWILNPAWLITDVRSAIIGSICGAIIGLITVAFATEPALERTIYTNDQGYAKPMPALLDPIAKEEAKLSITFDPEQLKEVFVCEYAHMTGSSSRELLFRYLDKYSMCLAVGQISDTEFIIRPNLRSGEIQRNQSGQWFCKCYP